MGITSNDLLAGTLLAWYASKETNSALNWSHTDQSGAWRFWVDCSDSFFWGSADGEDVTVEDLDLLGQSLVDASADPYWGTLLFVARKRGMRPQGARYKSINPLLWDAFDAAGPDRSVDFFNPRSRPETPELLPYPKVYTTLPSPVTGSALLWAYEVLNVCDSFDLREGLSWDLTSDGQLEFSMLVDDNGYGIDEVFLPVNKDTLPELARAAQEVIKFGSSFELWLAVYLWAARLGVGNDREEVDELTSGYGDGIVKLFQDACVPE